MPFGEIVIRIAALRVVVGCLGEKDHFSWWNSSFFSKSSEAFIRPVFPRTSFLVRYHGVVEAASRIHDSHVGRGDVYHLFRLPEPIEERLLEAIKTGGAKIQSLVQDDDIAIAYLAGDGSIATKHQEGPTAIGLIDDLGRHELVDTMAKAYHTAFTNKTMVFPYFTR